MGLEYLPTWTFQFGCQMVPEGCQFSIPLGFNWHPSEGAGTFTIISCQMWVVNALFMECFECFFGLDLLVKIGKKSSNQSSLFNFFVVSVSSDSLFMGTADLQNTIKSPQKISPFRNKNKGCNHWLVVSTHLKNISQIGNLPQIGVNKEK